MLKDKKFWVGFLVAYALLSFAPQFGFRSMTGKKRG